MSDTTTPATNAKTARPWFSLARHGLRTRDDYSRLFEEVETIVASYAGTVRNVVQTASGELTQEGIFKRLMAPRADVYRSADLKLGAIAAATTADAEAIEAILSAPDQPRATEDLLARGYQQKLVLRQLQTPRFDLLAELERAIQADDAHRAEVLADLGPTELNLSGPGDTFTSMRLASLQNRALRLRAAPERKAAFALQDALQGGATGDRTVAGVLEKLAFVQSSLAGRLELIDQDDGDDELVRTFTLDFPQPAGWVSNNFQLDGPALKGLLRRWYGIGTSVGTRS